MTDRTEYPWTDRGEPSPLAAAYDELRDRCGMCDEAGLWWLSLVVGP